MTLMTKVRRAAIHGALLVAPFVLGIVALWPLRAEGQHFPRGYGPPVWETEQHDGAHCPFMTLRVVNGCGDRDRMETVDTPHGPVRLGYDMRGGCYEAGGLPDVVKVLALPDGVWTWPEQRRFEVYEDGSVLEVQFCVDLTAPTG